MVEAMVVVVASTTVGNKQWQREPETRSQLSAMTTTVNTLTQPLSS